MSRLWPDYMASSLRRWRKELSAAAPSSKSLVPVVVGSSDEAKTALVAPSGANQTIEITLTNGRALKVPIDLNAAALKRLERGRFIWPTSVGNAVHLTPAQLGYLLEGIDWRAPQKTWSPEIAG